MGAAPVPRGGAFVNTAVGQVCIRASGDHSDSWTSVWCRRSRAGRSCCRGSRSAYTDGTRSAVASRVTDGVRPRAHRGYATYGYGGSHRPSDDGRCRGWRVQSLRFGRAHQSRHPSLNGGPGCHERSLVRVRDLHGRHRLRPTGQCGNTTWPPHGASWKTVVALADSVRQHLQ